MSFWSNTPRSNVRKNSMFLKNYNDLLKFPRNVSYAIYSFDRDKYCDSLYHKLGISSSWLGKNCVEKRKAEYLAGRYCAKVSLSQKGIDNFQVIIGADREPIWPNGVVGSITHSEKFASAIIADEKDYFGIGIDIEEIIPLDSINQIKNVVVDHRESEIMKSTALPFNTILTLVFSAKESFFKATFPRIKRFLDFDAIKFRGIDCSEQRMQFAITESLNESLNSEKQLFFNYIPLSEKNMMTYIFLSL